MRTSFVSLFLIFILISVAGLGFLGVACAGGMSFACPIFLSFGIECPTSGGDFASVFHHLAGSKEFSQFILVVFSFFVIGFLALSFLFFRKTFKEFFTNNFLVWEKSFQEPIPDTKLLYWLSLRNKGEPNSFSGRRSR